MTKEEINEIVRAEQNRYAREWRAKNPEKVAASKRRYWEKKALQRLAVAEHENVKGGN